MPAVQTKTTSAEERGVIHTEITAEIDSAQGGGGGNGRPSAELVERLRRRLEAVIGALGLTMDLD